VKNIVYFTTVFIRHVTTEQKLYFVINYYNILNQH